MTTLAADSPRTFHTSNLDSFDQLEAGTDDIIFRGAAVGTTTTGYAFPLLTSSAVIFAGFAEAKCDNTGGANGAKRVEIRNRGKVQLTVSGATRADIGKAVYASDDDTFTLTEGASTILIGFVDSCNTAGQPVVAFSIRRPAASIADFADTWTSTEAALMNGLLDVLQAQGILDPV